jgi:hypothetical protein
MFALGGCIVGLMRDAFPLSQAIVFCLQAAAFVLSL